jgi:hypothetical protein
LYISLLGDNPDYLAIGTDANGRFSLSMPIRYGPQEIYVATNPMETERLVVRIDLEFDAAQIQLPRAIFGLAEDERAVATYMALNTQFSRAYINLVLDSAKLAESFPVPFYGSKSHVLDMNDYVNLPTLEEVFINLVPEVNVVRKRGELSLKINSDRNDIGFFTPLIIIDNISIFDHEAILAIQPSKIKRLDVIPDIYMKGGSTFGGLIAIYTRDGDMAGVDLPSGAYFFDYLSFQPDQPQDTISGNQEDFIPDSRNTIFWRSDVLLTKGEPAELSFDAPSLRGEYVVLVRGVAPDGQVLSATTTFTVE